jgi:hypothetical protein
MGYACLVYWSISLELMWSQIYHYNFENKNLMAILYVIIAIIIMVCYAVVEDIYEQNERERRRNKCKKPMS